MTERYTAAKPPQETLISSMPHKSHKIIEGTDMPEQFQNKQCATISKKICAAQIYYRLDSSIAKNRIKHILEIWSFFTTSA